MRLSSGVLTAVFDHVSENDFHFLQNDFHFLQNDLIYIAEINGKAPCIHTDIWNIYFSSLSPVVSCPDIPYAIIQHRSSNSFLVTCTDGQTGSYTCNDGYWEPSIPECALESTSSLSTSAGRIDISSTAMAGEKVMLALSRGPLLFSLFLGYVHVSIIFL